MAKDRAQLRFCLAEGKGGQAKEGDREEEGVQPGGQSRLHQQSSLRHLRPSSSAQAAPVVKQRRRLQNQALQYCHLFRRQQVLRRKCWEWRLLLLKS